MGRAAGNRDSWWGLEKNRQAAQVDAAAHECEEYIPFEPTIVAGTDEFLVVDKPPFLPATPNGRIVANTVQERLRRKLGEPEIVAVHRLDLLTSGLMLLSRNPATRARYQQLFQNREITKEYECLTVMPDDWHAGQSREVTLLLDPNPAGRGVKVVEADDSARVAAKNPKYKLAHTTVTFLGPAAADIGDVLASDRGAVSSASIPLHTVGCGCGHCGSRMQVGHWRLQPHTGRTHQLRVTMDWLGYPILGEDTYGRQAGVLGPSSSEGSAPKYTPQLRLTATALAFVDPVTGERRTYRSARNIAAPADAPTNAS
ncbi:pseudouridine synthase [uncultured Corynebacterium sp.]|uniref:pseudouridine synthase n=1 Tax=uncultured Corynebacterium sp. TaxID=159447 RepID=UPI0026244507|nr:pseudouridine synthase [uncultured Corynebacterium sp.]